MRSSRHASPLVGLLALVVAALGGAALGSAGDASAGTAKGTLTVNGESVTLKHAYARKVMGATMPDSQQFELRAPDEGETAVAGTFVVLTDVPLPVADLTYVSVLMGALESGKVQGVSWIVDGGGQVAQQSMYHRALSRSVPGSPDTFELARLDERVAGKAAADGDFFDDAWTYDLTFDATVAPLPKASLQPGTATGTLTVDGQVHQLRHAYARVEPGSFDPKKKQVVLDLFDVEVPEKTLKSRFAMMDLARGGKAHGLSVTIDAEGDVISGSFYLAGLEMASSTGWQQLETVAFDKGAIEGRLYSREAHDLLGHTVAIDARFHVAAGAVQ